MVQVPAEGKRGSVETAARRSDRRWIIWLSLGIFVVYIGFGLALWLLGLFEIPANGPDSRIFAAVLALLGGLFATLMTFVGVLLKHSIDNRTLESHREAEGRLRLETSIRAVQLLATPEGKKAPPAQQAGALFALSSLGQLELALALLRELWPAGSVSSSAATSVVDRGLASADEALQRDAADILVMNSGRLPAGKTFHFPECVVREWQSDLPQAVRQQLLVALLRAIPSRPREEWDTDCLNGVMLLIDRVRRSDPAGYIKDGARVALGILVELDHLTDDNTFQSNPPVEVGVLRETLRNDRSLSKERISTTYARIAEELRVWAAPRPDLAAGRALH